MNQPPATQARQTDAPAAELQAAPTEAAWPSPALHTPSAQLKMNAMFRVYL